MEKPKALKKIDLEKSSQLKTRPLLNSFSATNTTKAGNSSVQKKPPTKENDSMLEHSSLPHPRDLFPDGGFKLINRQQQHLLKKQHLKPTQTINVMPNTKSSASTMLKKQQIQRPQKPFNLSTHITEPKVQVVKPINASTAYTFTAAVSGTTLNGSSLSTQDKTASRRQRHENLYKGRVPTAGAGVVSRKIDANIKGVRSNRRFELQMKHRKNLEN